MANPVVNPNALNPNTTTQSPTSFDLTGNNTTGIPGLTPWNNADATVIDTYLRDQGSPLAGQGANFVATGNQYGVDPYFLVSLTGAETSFGTTGNATQMHNPFGLGPNIVYANWQASIDAAGRTVKNYNAGTVGNTLKKWNPRGWQSEMGTVMSFLTDLHAKSGHSLVGSWIEGTHLGGASTGTGTAIVNDTTGAITGVANTFDNFFSWITDKTKWIRLGLLLGGIVLGVIALVVLVKTQTPGMV